MTVFLEDVNALGQNDVGFWETLIQKMRDLAGVAIIDLSSGLDAISRLWARVVAQPLSMANL